MDNEQLTKFRTVFNTAMWERLEDDILIPELSKARNLLEQGFGTDERYRGKIEFIKYLLSLKDYAKVID